MDYQTLENKKQFSAYIDSLKEEKKEKEQEIQNLIISRHDKMIEILTKEFLRDSFKYDQRHLHKPMLIAYVLAAFLCVVGIYIENKNLIGVGLLDVVVSVVLKSILELKYLKFKKENYKTARDVWEPEWELVEEAIKERNIYFEETKNIELLEEKVKNIDQSIHFWESKLKNEKAFDTKYRYKYEIEEEKEIEINRKPS